MAVLKVSALQQHLSRGHLAPAYLIYGSDPGKIGEIARSLICRAVGSLDDPFGVVRLDEETISDDPQRLADEVFSRPMLGSRKAIWISNAGAAFVRSYEELGELPLDGNVVVVEAANLAKSARLRTIFEKSRTAQTIACYEDRPQDIDLLIDEAFADARLKLTPDAKAALLNYLGENRALSRAEIDKLVLYCHGKDEIALAHVEAVCSGKISAELSELTDAVFSGDLPGAASLADRQLKAGVSGSRLLSGAVYHLALLERLALDVETGSLPAQVFKMARPPLSFTRQDSMVQQLKIWDGQALSAAALSLSNAVQQTREFPALEAQIAERSLLSVTRLAAGRRYQN
jgi:DNA polymerase-3 subunit delta